MTQGEPSLEENPEGEKSGKKKSEGSKEEGVKVRVGPGLPTGVSGPLPVGWLVLPRHAAVPQS